MLPPGSAGLHKAVNDCFAGVGTEPERSPDFKDDHHHEEGDTDDGNGQYELEGVD